MPPPATDRRCNSMAKSTAKPRSRSRQKYRLASRDVAAQSLEFDRKYRSYVINYSVGEALVRGYVDRHGHDPESRWAAYIHILSQPTLPADLRNLTLPLERAFATGQDERLKRPGSHALTS